MTTSFTPAVRAPSANSVGAPGDFACMIGLARRVQAPSPALTLRGAGTHHVRMRAQVRRGLFVGIGILYVASVPWYRETGRMPEVVLGLPDWVAVALGCYLGVAVLNAIAWWLTEVPDDPASSPPTGGADPSK